MTDFLRPGDYEEPICPLCHDRTRNDAKKRIPVMRMIEELDKYLDRNEYDIAFSHLARCLTEARNLGDDGGRLTLLNEMMGLCRKTGRKDEAYGALRESLALCENMGIVGSVTSGTTFLNAATVLKSFGDDGKALLLYEKVLEIYEDKLDEYDVRISGLCNNMALVLADTGEYGRAELMYKRALSVMSHNENCELETAITYLNMADCAYLSMGALESEKIVNDYIDRARVMLDTPSLTRNGYYAFVCEKCAPVFGFYGYFLDEAEYRKRAEKIYGAVENEGN